MSWATRATVIVAIPWLLFTSFLLVPIFHEEAGPMLLHLFIFEGIPIGALWIILRLILGNRGAVH